jgi:hypothetical protein
MYKQGCWNDEKEEIWKEKSQKMVNYLNLFKIY